MSAMRTFERWYPGVGAGVVAAVYWFTPSLSTHVLPDTLPSLLAAIVSIGGIAVGFMATIKAILISVDDRPIVQRMKEAGIYRRVLSFLRSGIRWSFLLTLVSAAALVVEYRGVQNWSPYYAAGTSLWLFLATGSVLSYVRVSSVWTSMLQHMDSKPTT